MKYYKIKTVNGFQYIKSKEAIRNKKQASQLLQELVVCIYPVSLVEYAIKKYLTKQSRGAIIKIQKGSERNEKSSEIKPTSQKIAETHSPQVMHIRAGQQGDRVFSEVRRRMEPVGILVLFYLAARARTMRAEFTIIPQPPHFVKQKLE